MNLLLFVTVAICLVLLVLCDRTMVQDDSTIAEINNLSPGWRAGHNPRFNNVSLADAAKLLGLAEVPTNLRASPKRLDSSVSVPASFDARQKWPQCIMPIRDQRSCGGCWGFAGASMFGMRQCIQSGGAVKVDMSPQYPISCDTANNGCNGGTIGSVWSFFQSSGSVADSSYPFTSGNGNTGTCSLRSGQQKYFAASYRRLSSVAEMQEEIYNNGAVQVGFDVYQDFYNYRSGVYVRTSNQKSGGHSVYVVGWGQENGTPYWIAINSWSANWGMGGTFYIRRGTNECNIETGFRPVAAVIRVVASPTTAVTTTRAPSSGGAGYDTRGCWTCPAGMTHWFNAGYGAAPGGDQCSCVSIGASPTTTRAPTAAPTTRAPSSGGYDTRGCWTCPAGMTHWFNAGLSTAPGGDQCACVVGGGSATTRAPTSAPAPPSGGAGYDTRGCWTCPSGFTHWFNAGLSTAPGNDRCACVAARATPTTARPTAYNTRGCWTCPSGYIHWFAKGYSSPTNGDQCQCLPQ